MPRSIGTHRISRRSLIARAGAGALTLSPMFSAIKSSIAREAAGDAPPKRFVFCVKSNGLWAEFIQPVSSRDRLAFTYESHIVEGRRAIVEGSEKGKRVRTPIAAADEAHDGKFSETMASLAPYSHRVTALQGLWAGFGVGPGGHSGQYRTLSATDVRKGQKHVTIDSVLARAFPAPIPLLCLGFDPRAASGLSYLPYSASGPDKPNVFYTKPSRVYADLFGLVDAGAAKSQYDVQSSILDFQAGDAKRLRSQLAGPEREQMDHYLNAFESLRQTRGKLEAMEDRIRKHKPEDPGELSALWDITSANAKIAAAALMSGLTNVVTICFDQLGSIYPGIGGIHRTIGHGSGGFNLEKRHKVNRSQFDAIATIAEKLDSIPEAGGTMLDNTVFVYLASNGGAHHSQEGNFPIMLLGNLGGRLQQGRFYAPGNSNDNEDDSQVRVGDVWATLLAAADQPHKDFGIPRNGIWYKPIEELLA